MTASESSHLCNILGHLIMGVNNAESEGELYSLVANNLPLLIPANRVSIALIDRDETEFEIIALFGINGELAKGNKVPCDSSTFIGHCYHNQSPELIRTSSSSHYQDLVTLCKEGLVQVMSAPLMDSSRTLGTLNIATTQSDLYGQAELNLLSQVSSLISLNINRLEYARQSKITMERHRRYAERLEVLNEMGRRLSSTTTHETAFHIVAEAIEYVLKADRVSYVTINPDEQTCQIFALTGNDIIPKAKNFPLPGSGIEAVLTSGKPTAFPDLSDSRYREHAMLVSQGLCMGWSVPIYVSGSIAGILNAATNTSWPFPNDALTLLSALGRFLGTTLERIEAQEDVKNTLQKLEYRVLHDSLTELPNRIWLERTLNQDIQYNSIVNSRLAVFFIDLDGFKEVNDSLSHSIGDCLLKEVADRLQDHLPVGGAIARMGGDEFVVILKDVRDDNWLCSVGQQLLDALKPPFWISDRRIQIGGSLGISLFPEHGKTAQELMKCADIAMYAAKERGRSTVQLYAQAMSDRLTERLKLEQALQQAIARDELSLVLQPQVDMATGRVCALEALIRWHHPTMGSIPPLSFIPIAEEMGLIGDISAWVVNQSLSILASLRQHHPDLYISVNISAQDLLDPDQLQDHIEASLERYHLPGHVLELELTESVFLEHAAEVNHLTKHWKDRGIRLAIDDFGTGFSSLSYLLKLPIDTLKIDRSFVTSVHDDRRTQGVVKTILALGENLDVTCVAEGVEDAEQLKTLHQLGCSKVQGYFLAKPMEVSQLSNFLAHDRETASAIVECSL